MRWPRLLHLKARSTVARLCVACLTLVVVVGIELGRQMGHPVPVPFLLMYGSVFIAASVSGLIAGLLASVFAGAFVIYAAVVDFGPETLTGGPLNVSLGVAVSFLIAIAIGGIRDDRQNLIQQLQSAQVQLEARSASLEEQVAAQNIRLREMTTRLLNLQEDERAYLARELHDEVGQALTGLKLSLASIRREDGAVDERWDVALESVDTLMEQVRTMSAVLRPALLDQFGLTAAIRWYVQQQSQRAGLEVTTQLDDVPDTLTKRTAILLFRCVQEVMTNVIKHAEATQIAVTLHWNGRDARLEISDDGKGFEAPAVWTFSSKGGLGIPGMQERFALSGGSFTIESRRGFGTKVVATAPNVIADG